MRNSMYFYKSLSAPERFTGAAPRPPASAMPRNLRSHLLASLRALFAAGLLAPVLHISDGLADATIAEAASTVSIDASRFEEGSGMVNINVATASELAAALNGVGLSRAEAIVRYREQFGPFESVDELSEVSGIGAATVEKNRRVIAVQ